MGNCCTADKIVKELELYPPPSDDIDI